MVVHYTLRYGQKYFLHKDEHYIDALDTIGIDNLDSVLPELNISDFNGSSDRILKVALNMY